MMDLDLNTSLDSNHGSTNDSKQDAKKQQFTTKQRIDMYAFCVLELELHGNTVSIKKQQQAIQKALKKERAQTNKSVIGPSADGSLSESNGAPVLNDHQNQYEQQQTDAGNNYQILQPDTSNNHPVSHIPMTTSSGDLPEQFDSFPRQSPQQQQQHQSNPPSTTSPVAKQPSSAVSQQPQQNSMTEQQPDKALEADSHNGHNYPTTSSSEAAGKKTLLELQKEIAKTQRCYSDYQKTRVLTSSMLREVQKRFARYYPDTPCPSRTTIKHVFMKCVENGTVENVKNPRKPTKIPNGEQIEQFLIEEPAMSLREMAKKLNVSTGTVSRRCRALGIVPESVTLKHQQMAMAKRQKQMKHLTTKTKTSGRRTSTAGSSRQNQATLNHHEQSHYTNGMV